MEREGGYKAKSFGLLSFCNMSSDGTSLFGCRVVASSRETWMDRRG